MAARSGQRGCIVKNGNFWAVRFRVDVPGQFERKLRYVRICPIEGEGHYRKLSGTGRLSISSLRRERTARKFSIKQNLQLLRFESNHKSGSLPCPIESASPSSHTRSQIGGVILSGLTSTLETLRWRASIMAHYGILSHKCMRQDSNQKQ